MSAPMRTQFGMVPAWVDEQVTDGTAMRVYVRLVRKYANHDRHAFPTIETLAGELDISPKTVKRAIALLQRVGAIVVTRTRQPDGNYGRNRYWLPMDDPHQGSQMTPGSDQAQQVDQGSNMTLHQGSNMTPREPDPSLEPDKSKELVSADAQTDTGPPQLELVPSPSEAAVKPAKTGTAEAFDQFWRFYPRKIAKQAARRAWDKAVKGVDPRVIITGARRYAVERHFNDPAGKYTKHPATWLNGGCWEDEVVVDAQPWRALSDEIGSPAVYADDDYRRYVQE